MYIVLDSIIKDFDKVHRNNNISGLSTSAMHEIDLINSLSKASTVIQ